MLPALIGPKRENNWFTRVMQRSYELRIAYIFAIRQMYTAGWPKNKTLQTSINSILKSVMGAGYFTVSLKDALEYHKFVRNILCMA